MEIKPIQDRLVVQPIPADETTASGIFIPESSREKPQQGRVIAVGPGNKDVQMLVKTGDTILYGKNVGTEFPMDDDKFLIMRQSDILAIV